MSDAFLACRDVVKHFGSTEAVDGASFELTEGHLFALVGPSGCGKTTLLRIIAGFEAPDAGEIELGGRLLCGRGRFVQPEKRRISMVFQDFALFPHMNVAANIAFGLPKGADKKKRIGELLDLVGLQGMQSRMPHQLSGGQQQRVALARALASEPELILLDEPFSNLDPSIRARVRREVKQLLLNVGITAVFVTHDQEEALSLAEQVGVMIAGRIHQIGTPAEVYGRPATRDVGEFIGDANFFEGEVHDSSIKSELGMIPLETHLKGWVQVMVRAESLAISEHEGVPAEVVSSEYFGHDQMVTVRLASGKALRIRLSSEPQVALGHKVGVVVRGEAFAFPLDS